MKLCCMNHKGCSCCIPHSALLLLFHDKMRTNYIQWLPLEVQSTKLQSHSLYHKILIKLLILLCTWLILPMQKHHNSTSYVFFLWSYSYRHCTFTPAEEFNLDLLDGSTLCDFLLFVVQYKSLLDVTQEENEEEVNAAIGDSPRAPRRTSGERPKSLDFSTLGGGKLSIAGVTNTSTAG